MKEKEQGYRIHRSDTCTICSRSFPKRNALRCGGLESKAAYAGDPILDTDYPTSYRTGLKYALDDQSNKFVQNLQELRDPFKGLHNLLDTIQLTLKIRNSVLEFRNDLSELVCDLS